jgi:5' nucleotidase family
MMLCRRFVKRAMHGTRMLSWAEIRQTYGRDLVNLRNESRWQFLNTLFSVSEAVMYMQVLIHVRAMTMRLVEPA